MEKLDPYFIEEATEMLQTIEENLLMILEDKTANKVHNLLRSAHTLKGSAITVGLETIHKIAHHLEDVFQALYAPELEITPELGSLLFDGYECLRTPLSAVLSGSSYDRAEALDRTATVFAKLQAEIGDFFGREAPMMTSEELGFDVVGSIFNDTVPQDLADLQAAIATANPKEIEQVLLSVTNFFLNLAQSYSLPGLARIADTIAIAIEQNPDSILEIAEAAKDNFNSAREAILAGDRSVGGEVSQKLLSLAQISSDRPTAELIATPSESENTSQTEVAIIPTQTTNDEGNLTLQPVAELAKSTIAELTTTNPLDRILNSIAIAQPNQEIAASPSPIASQPPTAKPLSTVKVAIEQLDNLSHTLNELSIEEDRQNLETDRIYRATRSAFKQFLSCQKQLKKVRNSANYDLLNSAPQNYLNANINLTSNNKNLSSRLQFDSLEMDKYDRLDLLFQGLAETLSNLGEKIETIDSIIQQSRFRHSKRKQLFSSARENLLASRMTPLAIVFDRFPRLVKQMISSHNKPAELEIFGGEVLIDKTICEKLYDPLLHLIRNAYDHGLEATEERQQQGKPAIGTIAIRAYCQGNRTTIEVKDDGKGLNWEKIRSKAIEKEILSATEAKLISEVELAEVLFEPGFSTADKIGELSGRGVGLDVVRDRIIALEGSISIESTAGVGTTFLLQLPLKLTTDRLLVCEAGGITYALLTQAIEQILLPQPEQIQIQKSLLGQGEQKFLLWHKNQQQELIPIIKFVDRVSYQYPLYYQEKNHFSLAEIATKNQINPLLLLKKDGQLLCLQIERILLEQELVIKTLDENPVFPNYIQGYSVLGNGSLTLVIDPLAAIGELDFNGNIAPIANFKALNPATVTDSLALQASDPQIDFDDSISDRVREMPTIMVVEDSIVQRKNIVATLTEAGYQVVEAGNGKEALELCDRHPEIKLILSDIEMPLINGFEFLGKCQQNPDLAKIPIIMLTTRSSSKHRQAAFDLGAKDYCIKPYSDREILESIAKFLD